MWNVGDFTWPGVVEFLWRAKFKRGIKNLSSVPVNVLRKTRIGTNFSRRSRAINSDRPGRVVVFGSVPQLFFTFSLPLSTLFCFCSLVNFWKCRVALTMATLHSCKISWRWTLLRIIIHWFINIWVACSRPVDSDNLQNFKHTWRWLIFCSFHCRLRTGLFCKK